MFSVMEELKLLFYLVLIKCKYNHMWPVAPKLDSMDLEASSLTCLAFGLG